jgi:methionyl-tRNA synthetase
VNEWLSAANLSRKYGMVRDARRGLFARRLTEKDGKKIAPRRHANGGGASYFIRLSLGRQASGLLRTQSISRALPPQRGDWFVKQGMHDLSFAHGAKWGCGSERPDHVMYVWLMLETIDALGYRTKTREKYKTTGPRVHVVEKDILRFMRSIGRFLMGAGLNAQARFRARWWTCEGTNVEVSRQRDRSNA